MVFGLVIKYGIGVTLSTKRLLSLAGAVIIAGTAPVGANPYLPIVERNAFGLKPPPPPPPVEAPPPPAPPAIQVKLTGISSLLNHKRALLEITEPGGKPPKKPILSEGEKLDAVEVISIDVDKSQVVIKNSGVTTNLTFAPLESASAKTGPAPPGPAVPGMPVAPTVIPAFPAPAGGSAAAPSPTMINPGGPSAGGGSSGRNAIVLSGGGGATATPSGAPTVSTLGGAPTPSFGNPALGGATGTPTPPGLRTIPSRQIRSDTAVPGNTGRPMSREEVLITIEANRLMNQGKGLPPLPPTALTPLIQGDDAQ